MSVLVDTSVWVNFFRNGDMALAALLERDRVLMHPLILLEIACGTPPAPRSNTLTALGRLQPTNQASFDEVAAFIERERLYGLGCGVVDMSLLASTLITPGATLWTADKRLFALCQHFDIAYQPGLH
ncbi:MAG: hypothetical protein RL210_1680 [Pseudomonadota bacterium]|mgnify:CR=1 FL=1|jgi:predicted nucleic acid-binding protein